MQLQYARRAPAQNVSTWHNGPRQDLLDRDRDMLLRDETRDASVQDRDIEDFVRDETLVRLETETSWQTYCWSFLLWFLLFSSRILSKFLVVDFITINLFTVFRIPPGG